MLLDSIGTTLRNFKVPKELSCGYMGPYQSFKLPNVIYYKKASQNYPRLQACGHVWARYYNI
jgi:hypothetical protein